MIIIQISQPKMLRFNKNLSIAMRFFGGGKVDPSLLIPLKKNVDPEIRDKIHLEYMEQPQRELLYEQSRVRKPFALYNIMSKLPANIAQHIAKLSSDTKVIIKSDNLYLPRLTKNGVPVYDSLRAGKMAILLRSGVVLLPIIYCYGMGYPGSTLMAATFAFWALYRITIGALYKGLVLKMELVPQTEEILIQRAGYLGCCNTNRVKLDDLQYYDKMNLNWLFYATAKPYIDSKMVFRIKSTGELLFFDVDGLWYEEGLNHELLV